MYFLLGNLEMLIYLISFFLLLAAFNLSVVSRQRYLSLNLLRHNSFITRITMLLKILFLDESTDKLFRDAGFPPKLTAFNFSLFRLILFLLAFVLITLEWLLGNHPFPTSSVGLLAVAFALTSTKSQMPFAYLLKKLKELNTLKKNKECFLLYNMLLNEFYSEDQKPYNIYSILQKFSSYFETIKPAILKTLSVWKRSPEQALNLFAAEIGTEEARDLAQILKSIDVSGAAEARDIIKSRYEQFQTSRHEQHRRKLKNIDLCGYVAVFIPTIAILFNMVFVLGIAVQGLFQRLNYH